MHSFMEEIKAQASTTPPLSNESSGSFVKPLEESDQEDSPVFSAKSLLMYAVISLLGIGAGYLVYAYKAKNMTSLAGKKVETVLTDKEEGVKDAAAFKDTAIGSLLANDGKLVGEGTHILNRGDVSQNVYLTSAVVDLSKYEGKKVQVWGETYKGQRAGWLMDVGRVKIL